MIRIPCPACARVVKGPDDVAGKKVKCPECGHSWRVAAEVPPPAASPAPQAKPPISEPSDFAFQEGPVAG
jgi:hypothetical protein